MPGSGFADPACPPPGPDEDPLDEGPQDEGKGSRTRDPDQGPMTRDQGTRDALPRAVRVLLYVSLLALAGEGGRGGRGGGRGGAAPTPPTPAEWLSDSPDKLYFTRLSRDMHRLDVCVADASTGEVRTLIEERLNTYIESKPLRLVSDQTELLFWSERDGWGHYHLYDAATGTLKNRITEGEFVTTGIDSVDEQARVLYITAAGRERGEDPYYTHLYRVGFDGTASSSSIRAMRRTRCRSRSRADTS